MRPSNSLIGLGAAVALFATVGLPLVSNADPLPEDGITQFAAGELPPTIPSLNWTGAEGQWSLGESTRIVAPAEFAPRAAVFAQELDVYLNPANAATDLVPATPGAVEIATSGADADDIEIVLDTARTTELGTEGYELQIASDGVTITAADERGAFYGTRSLSQLLRQTTTLPAGSSLDVPMYEERGVTLCACQINIQTDFIDRLLTDMADLKLNHLLLEMKLETDDPRNNTWSYYTRDDVAELVAKADVLGIDVIPEINSPGHLGIWLEHRPDLQLRNNAGNRNQNQLDLSHPEALTSTPV